MELEIPFMCVPESISEQQGDSTYRSSGLAEIFRGEGRKPLENCQ